VEAQLIDTAARPSPAAGLHPARPQTELLVRIDRYLRAAGAADSRLRSRLIAAAMRRLATQGGSSDVTWAEVIAAVDHSLTAEFASDAASTLDKDAPPPAGVGGRIALHRAAEGMSAVDTRSLPPRHQRPMPPQVLLPWRPTPGWFRRLKPHPSAPALAASLCCLVVLFLS